MNSMCMPIYSGDRLVVLLNGEIVAEIRDSILYVIDENLLQISNREDGDGDGDGDEFVVHLNEMEEEK